MIKLPEGIGFTADMFGSEPLTGSVVGKVSMHLNAFDAQVMADVANAALPTLFEAWVKREGVRLYGDSDIGWFEEQKCPSDTHQAYLMLHTEIEK